MTKGIAIYPDKAEVVEVNGLDDMQAIVDGWIEPVDLANKGTMYVNEEFTYHFERIDENVNHLASDVAGIIGGRRDLMLGGILGPVLVVGPLDEEGYDTDITLSLANAIRSLSENTPGQYVELPLELSR